MIKTIKIGICAALLLLPGIAGAQDSQERIVSYHSNIEVFADSTMVVEENIVVVSTGDQIRRGIYRDFPIAYSDQSGRRYLVSFEIIEVQRDGSSEPYHIERSGNGLRVYVGQEDVFISPGQHAYTIKYKTARQLGFFADHDELYWNVTGNGWVFPIAAASATVRLPGGIDKDKITTTLYTGVQGSTGQDGTSAVNNVGTVSFAASRALGPNEGLTIVVGWPKGFVAEPTAAQNFWAGVRANADYLVGGLGLLLVLAFYLYAWNKRGRDPRRGAIIAQYEPPRDLSPAAMRYIRRMGSDNKALAAAIISMGVKGWLTMTENKGLLKKTTYTLTKNQAGRTAVPLSAEEQVLFEGFFAGGETFELKKSQAAKIVAIQNDFAATLKDQAGKTYFAKNIPAVVIGILLSAVTLVGTGAAAAFVRFGIASAAQIIFWPALAISLVVTNIVFAWLMRAFTVEGQKLADEIDGFKLFLSVTEQDRLAFHNPPERTPELFEKMLPYALALGVEHQWAEQFAETFARLEQRGVNYIPAWYVGSSIAHFNPDNFASAVGSTFTGVVSSAATPPGSSSGFSGGSSGGGGGGGGGGGW